MSTAQSKQVTVAVSFREILLPVMRRQTTVYKITNSQNSTLVKSL